MEENKVTALGVKLAGIAPTRKGKKAYVRHALDREARTIKDSLRNGLSIRAIARGMRGDLIKGDATAPSAFALGEWICMRRFEDEELAELTRKLDGTKRVIAMHERAAAAPTRAAEIAGGARPGAALRPSLAKHRQHQGKAEASHKKESPLDDWTAGDAPRELSPSLGQTARK